MTEDGEAPGAGSDGDEEERDSGADRDGSAADGVERGADGDERPPGAGEERGPAESTGDAVGPGSEVGAREDDVGEGDRQGADVDADAGTPDGRDPAAADPWDAGGEDGAEDEDGTEAGDWTETGTTDDEETTTRAGPTDRAGADGADATGDAELGDTEIGDAETGDAGAPTGSRETSPEGDATGAGPESGGGANAGPSRAAPEEATDESGSESSRGEGTSGAVGEFQGTDGSEEADGQGVTAGADVAPEADVAAEPDVPEDVRSYDRFKKVDRASYDRVNEFLRDRTYVTAREWAIARLCADFRTATGVEMTKIGENLPHLVPFMTDTYSPQAVNQARSAFEGKVRKSGATFLYGAMSGFFTADELDEIMYEVTEVAKFLLEVEGVELTVDEELDAEDRISAVMREVRQASEELRYDEVACPHCGEAFRPAED